MKLENLKIGMEVKNYPELCKLLELETNTGYAKQRQLEWFEEYFVYSKKGHKFIIEEVFNKEVLPMEDNRGCSNPVKYMGNLEKLILNLMLTDEKDKMIFLSKSKMLKYLKMVNHNYSICKVNTSTVSSITNISEGMVEEWFNSVDSLLQRNIEGALRNLHDQRLVLWSRDMTIHVNDTVESELVATGEMALDANGEEFELYKRIFKKENIKRLATKDEALLVIKLERETMEEMGCYNIQGVVVRKLWKEFKSKVVKKLEACSDITFYYDSYVVYFNREHIDKIAKQIEDFELSKEDQASNEKEVNSGIQERTIENAQKRQGKGDLDKYLHRYLEGYIEDCNELNDIMLDLNTNRVISYYQINEEKKRIDSNYLSI